MTNRHIGKQGVHKFDSNKVSVTLFYHILAKKRDKLKIPDFMQMAGCFQLELLKGKNDYFKLNF